MRTLAAQELRDIATGSAVLGTGGGGDPYIGTLGAVRSLEFHGPPQLISGHELGDSDLVVFPFCIGSPVPLIEKFPIGKEMVQAYRGLEQFLGQRIAAVMPAEVGGINSMVPLGLGPLLGVPVVDGDCMGRAFPEVQLVTLTLYGIQASPFAIADERGNHVVLNTIDNFWSERFGRSVAIDFGAICAGVTYPVTGRQLREATILGSLSHAESIGQAIRRARAEKQDAVEAVANAANGVILFRGKIVDVQRRTQRGWALGEAVLEGMDEHQGRQMIVRFQNENLVAVLDDEIVASVPDLITILDAESGEAITTEHLRYGFRVVVLGMPCDPKWRTPEGIDLAGPRHFGYDIDYVPLEERFHKRKVERS